MLHRRPCSKHHTRQTPAKAAENAVRMAKFIAENAGRMAKFIAENADYYLKSYWNIVCYIKTYKSSWFNGIKTDEENH